MAFQQGNLQKALVHEIVLGKQSTFFPTRLSERVVHVQHQPISIHSEPTEEILQRRRSYKWQDSKDHQTKPLHDESETMGISIRVWWNTPRRRFSLQHRGTVGRNVFHPRRSRKKIWITNFMMHDIARPMKDPLHHRRLLPMKNFFGTVGSVR